MAGSRETTMKELYGVQERPSGLSLNPLAQAQENAPPGTGRQICWQAFGLLLQPLGESAASKKKKKNPTDPGKNGKGGTLSHGW